MKLGGHEPIGQAADGATAGDRGGITLSGSMTQPLATAPLSAAQILLRSKHQCILCTISYGLELKRRMQSEIIFKNLLQTCIALFFTVSSPGIATGAA